MSKINAKDVKTRIVRFQIDDFRSIMDLGRGITIAYLKSVTDSLLSKVISFPFDNGGYTSFQLFKECTVSQDESNGWYVEIDAHDKALPLFFEFKDRYFTYQLWNALRLKSSNQLRMYEILKQYESTKYRILRVDDLKELLGIGREEYPRFERFKTRVLDACQEALAEHTDIKFTYEPYGKKGKGGKVLQLKFTIAKNTGYKDSLSLREFIELNHEADESDTVDLNSLDSETDNLDALVADGRVSQEDARMIFFRGAIEKRFSIAEVEVCYNIVSHKFPEVVRDGDSRVCSHLKYWFAELKLAEEKGNIQRSVFGYFKKLVAKPIPDAGASVPADKSPKNRFSNFEGRDIDYTEYEKLERVYLDEKLEASERAAQENQNRS